jgi:hypothetical protein
MFAIAKFSLALITSSMVAACANSPRVQSNHDGGLDFSQYEAFNFSSRKAIENPDLSGQLELYFSAAVEQQLLLRGLVRSDQPDILINVSVDVDDVSAPPARANNCPSYDDYYSRRVADSYGGEGRRPMCIYTEGTILVDMVDVALNRKIWEGVSRVRMDDRDRGASLLRSVVTDVATMFEGPPSLRSSPNPIHPYNPASASRGIISTVPRGDG